MNDNPPVETTEPSIWTMIQAVFTAMYRFIYWTLEQSLALNIALFIAVVILYLILVYEIAVTVERFTKKNITRRIRKDERRDRVRTYTRDQRAEGMKRCGHQCEGTGLFLRCGYRGDDLHGDHWYPHARGGATTTRNLVMLCPTCNRRKSAKIPTFAQTVALSTRRLVGANYFTPEKKIGEWLPNSYNRTS